MVRPSRWPTVMTILMVWFPSWRRSPAKQRNSTYLSSHYQGPLRAKYYEERNDLARILTLNGEKRVLSGAGSLGCGLVCFRRSKSCDVMSSQKATCNGPYRCMTNRVPQP